MPTTFLDMDGVLFDFAAGVRAVFPNVPLDADWPKGHDDFAGLAGVSQTEFWKRIDKEGPAWWEKLPRYVWADELLALSGKPIILTSPSHSPEAHAGKVLALQRWLGWSFRDYVIAPRKHKRLLAAPDRILIDDHDENVRQFIEAGGDAVLFPRPWNRFHERAGEPMSHVKASLLAMECR